MNKMRRRVTLEETETGEKKKPSVFERLGPGGTSRSVEDQGYNEKCRHWLKYGTCTYGANCRFQHGSGKKITPEPEDLRSKVSRKRTHDATSPISPQIKQGTKKESKLKSTVVVSKQPSQASGDDWSGTEDDLDFDEELLREKKRLEHELSQLAEEERLQTVYKEMSEESDEPLLKRKKVKKNKGPRTPSPGKKKASEAKKTKKADHLSPKVKTKKRHYSPDSDSSSPPPKEKHKRKKSKSDKEHHKLYDPTSPPKKQRKSSHGDTEAVSKSRKKSTKHGIATSPRNPYESDEVHSATPEYRSISPEEFSKKEYSPDLDYKGRHAPRIEENKEVSGSSTPVQRYRVPVSDHNLRRSRSPYKSHRNESYDKILDRSTSPEHYKYRKTSPEYYKERPKPPSDDTGHRKYSAERSEYKRKQLVHQTRERYRDTYYRSASPRDRKARSPSPHKEQYGNQRPPQDHRETEERAQYRRYEKYEDREDHMSRHSSEYQKYKHDKSLPNQVPRGHGSDGYSAGEGHAIGRGYRGRAFGQQFHCDPFKEEKHAASEYKNNWDCRKGRDSREYEYRKRYEDPTSKYTQPESSGGGQYRAESSSCVKEERTSKERGTADKKQTISASPSRKPESKRISPLKDTSPANVGTPTVDEQQQTGEVEENPALLSDWSDDDIDEQILNQSPKPTDNLLKEEENNRLEGKESIEYDPISDDELEELLADSETVDQVANPVIVDALDIDWKSLIKGSRPNRIVPTADARFTTANIFSKYGISSSLAGEQLLSEVLKLNEDCFESPVAAIHGNLTNIKTERSKLLSDVGPYRRALCSRRDLSTRRQLCKLDKGFNQQILFPTPVFDRDLYQLSVQLFKSRRLVS